MALVANVGTRGVRTGFGACVMVYPPAAAIRVVARGKEEVVGDSHLAHVAFVLR